MLGWTFFFRVFRVFRGRLVPVVLGGLVRGWDGDRKWLRRGGGEGSVSRNGAKNATRAGRGGLGLMLGWTCFFSVFRVFRGRLVPVVLGGFLRGMTFPRVGESRVQDSGLPGTGKGFPWLVVENEAVGFRKSGLLMRVGMRRGKRVRMGGEEVGQLGWVGVEMVDCRWPGLVEDPCSRFRVSV